ncbi:MAG: hypothetical protein KDB14_21865 [Planctomycetales bacterium]|nr:hypothetical protein [Planctomycetales bacterium]
MNRIQRVPASQPLPAHLSSPRIAFPAKARQAAPGLAHALFRPQHYEPNYAYPLIVYLHGPRGSERQVHHLMPELSVRNYAAVAPRGIAKHPDGGYLWGECPTSEQISEAHDRVCSCVEIARQTLNIGDRRVFLAGYEDGGSMALRLALRSPSMFAGAISLCGPFPVGQAPLSNLRNARNLPLMIANGRDASRYTVDQSCRELRLFHAAGLSVSLRQYPCGDDLDSNMLRDMNAWIMEQVTGVHSEVESTSEFESEN